MKPKNLISPFSRTERQVMIEDRIWYVPPLMEDYTSFTFPGWEHPLLFNNTNPVSIEYCSGNGAWIASQAKQHQSENWIAVEKKFDRIRKIWSKIKNDNIPNLVGICGEGHCVTENYFPTASIKNIYINFPDPWPKTRHAKHRIIQPTFILQLHRILKVGGLLTIVTDDERYSASLIQTLNAATGFRSQFPSPYYITDYPGYGTSYFEDLWREKGKTIHYHVYQKMDVPS
jgi:tRNA (guanine-N7-)-methyltransferase